MSALEHVKGGWKSLKGYWFKNIIIGLFFQVLFIINYALTFGFIQIGLLGLIIPLITGLILQCIQQCGRIYCSLIMVQRNQLVFKDYFNFIKSRQRFQQCFSTWLIKNGLILLWSLTIVMGPIKSLAYRMSLYKIAEKQNLGPFEAINRSSEMMTGKKCELFKMSVGFWIIYAVYYIMWTVALSEEGNDDSSSNQESNDGAVLILSLVILLYVLFIKLILAPLYYNSTACFYLSLKGDEEASIQVNNETVRKELQVKDRLQGN